MKVSLKKLNIGSGLYGKSVLYLSYNNNAPSEMISSQNCLNFAFCYTRISLLQLRQTKTKNCFLLFFVLLIERNRKGGKTFNRQSFSLYWQMWKSGFGPQIVCPGFWQLSLDTQQGTSECYLDWKNEHKWAGFPEGFVN